MADQSISYQDDMSLPFHAADFGPRRGDFVLANPLNAFALVLLLLLLAVALFGGDLAPYNPDSAQL